MKQKNRQKGEIQKSDRFRDAIVNYVDIVIRGLIAFIFLGIILSIVLVGFFGLKPFLVLPIIFLLSVFSSPLLSKIRIGEALVRKYDNWLNRIFGL